MAKTKRKRGQKFLNRFSRASMKVSREGKEHIRENIFQRVSHVRNVRLLVFEWSFLVTALILLALAQAFWFGDSYAENVFSDDGTYTEATIGEVNSLNPLFAITNSEETLSKLMFSTITAIDYSGHVGNQLAKSVTASEDGKNWTVVLKDGLKWSDGEPLTNEDVLFTVGLIKNPAVNTVYDANMTGVELNENEQGELVFSLPTAYADFSSALDIPIVPKHILGDSEPKNLIENNFSTSPVTSGPFMLNAVQSSNRDKNETYYLSANPNYYQNPPMLSSFAVRIYQNKDEVENAINTGSVTATAELSGSDADKIAGSNFLQKDSSLDSGVFIFFNTENKLLETEEMRAAIRQGIDIERIRSEAPETKKLDFPLLDSQIKLEKYPELAEYNFAEAEKVVSRLIGDGKKSLNIATVNSGYLPAVTNTLAEELRNLGFEANVSTFEENQEFVSNVISHRGYDILVYVIELGAEPDLLPYFHSSQASSTGLNLSNYKNPLVNDLLLGARSTMDEGLRKKKYQSFLEYWAEDTPAIGLYQPNLTYFYNRNARTFRDDARLETALDRFVDVTNWAVNKATKNKTP